MRCHKWCAATEVVLGAFLLVVSSASADQSCNPAVVKGSWPNLALIDGEIGLRNAGSLDVEASVPRNGLIKVSATGQAIGAKYQGNKSFVLARVGKSAFVSKTTDLIESEGISIRQYYELAFDTSDGSVDAFDDVSQSLRESAHKSLCSHFAGHSEIIRLRGPNFVAFTAFTSTANDSRPVARAIVLADNHASEVFEIIANGIEYRKFREITQRLDFQ